jgi:hypothetical protein
MACYMDTFIFYLSSVLRYTTSDEMGSNYNRWVGKDKKGDKRGPFKCCSIVPAFGRRHCEKQKRNSFRKTGNLGGIPIRYLSNTSLEYTYYRYRHLLGNLWISTSNLLSSGMDVYECVPFGLFRTSRSVSVGRLCHGNTSIFICAT